MDAASPSQVVPSPVQGVALAAGPGGAGPNQSGPFRVLGLLEGGPLVQQRVEVAQAGSRQSQVIGVHDYLFAEVRLDGRGSQIEESAEHRSVPLFRLGIGEVDLPAEILA